MSLERIEKKIKENDKQWNKRTTHEGIALISFFTILFALLFVFALYENILAIMLSVVVYIPIGFIILVLFIIRSGKLREKDEYMKDALWIYKNWVHNNKLDDGFYKHVHPKNYDKKALIFLAVDIGVILVIGFNEGE